MNFFYLHWDALLWPVEHPFSYYQINYLQEVFQVLLRLATIY